MKIGLFGGTFDPIHRAHVKLADTAVKEIGLDQLIFMPAYVSPFKQGIEMASIEDRYNMIKSVLHYNKAFNVSDYEINRKGTSYTIETLKYLSSKYSSDLYFILGYDSLVQIDTWYKGAEILRNYPLISVMRPGTNIDNGLKKIEQYRNDYCSQITLLHMDAIDISATEIRRRIKDNEDISSLVLPEVEEYIIDHKLYK